LLYTFLISSGFLVLSFRPFHLFSVLNIGQSDGLRDRTGLSNTGACVFPALHRYSCWTGRHGPGGWGMGFNIRVGFIHISLFFARLEWERGLLIYLTYQTSLILNL
jgi:hypothetical protein